jgi:hypothetical protein
VEEGEAVVDTALLLVVSPALFHTVLSVVVSVAEVLVAEAHHVFLSVVVVSHSFRLRILTLLSSRWHDTGLLPSVPQCRAICPLFLFLLSRTLEAWRTYGSWTPVVRAT